MDYKASNGSERKRISIRTNVYIDCKMSDGSMEQWKERNRRNVYMDCKVSDGSMEEVQRTEEGSGTSVQPLGSGLSAEIESDAMKEPEE